MQGAGRVSSGASQRGLFGSALGWRTLDYKLIMDAEGTGSRVGLHSSYRGVTLIGDNAIQRDVAVLHNDVDRVIPQWRIGCDAAGHPGHAGAAANASCVGVVPAQGGSGIDAVIDRGANPVVVR